MDRPVLVFISYNR